MATSYLQPREARHASPVIQPDEAAYAGPEPSWQAMLVGNSRALRETLETIRLVAPRRSTVLITGETGTGKEVVARALHAASPRADRQMVIVNAAALPDNLLEAELFGHMKGAFTGAVQQRVGRFEQAHRSTLFLDEIGDLPLSMQTKLLRFLQEREFERIGSSETIRVDVRLVAATNADLEAKVREGNFRQDLYYRLNVVPIVTTPLRERPGDVPVLARHFAARICDAEQIPLRTLSADALDLLASLPWPGNVRQLENTIERAIALCGQRQLLTSADFAGIETSPPHELTCRLEQAALEKIGAAPEHPMNSFAIPPGGLDFEQTMNRIEARVLEEALRRTTGNKTAAAELLRLKRTTLSAKLRALGIADTEKSFAAGA